MLPEDAKDAELVVVAWFTAEAYPRAVELFPDYPETFAEFVLNAADKLARLGIRPERVRRIIVDPDAMFAWCMANRGDIEADDRAAYIAEQFGAPGYKGGADLQ